MNKWIGGMLKVIMWKLFVMWFHAGNRGEDFR